MFLAALAIAGTWVAAKYAPRGEARAEVQALVQVRTQEVVSVAFDTPSSPRHERLLPLAEMRSALTTKSGDLLDETTLATDRVAVETVLKQRGYLAATIATPSVTFTKNGGAYVVFDVERGPLFRIRSVTVTGPGESERDVVTIAAGDDALPARIEHAKQVLAEALAHKSKLARVELRVHEDLAAAAVDVELVTTEVTARR
jgi:outer membrane protein assembly factor BamA